MKRILLACSLIMGISAGVSAQCTPGPNFANGVYPDSATNFGSGCKDQPYEQVISLRIPTDTNVVYNGLPVTANIQTIELESVTGLPTGLTLVCGSPYADCKFPGGQEGCAVIAGTTSDVGVHNLVFYLKTTASVSIQPPLPAVPVTQKDTLDYYKIIIDDCGGTSVVNADNTASFDVYPNPAKENVTISNLVNDGLDKTIQVINAEGKVIKTLHTDKNSLSISTEDIKSGIYFVKVTQKNAQETVKLVIE